MTFLTKILPHIWLDYKIAILLNKKIAKKKVCCDYTHSPGKSTRFGNTANCYCDKWTALFQTGWRAENWAWKWEVSFLSINNLRIQFLRFLIVNNKLVSYIQYLFEWS